MNKKLTLLGLVCALASGALFTGCATTKGLTPEQQSQLVEDTAVILRSAARSGALFAMEDDPGTARWFAFSQQVLSTFLTGKDYSPAAFQKALNDIPVKELKQKWIKYAVYNVLDIYQLYYGRYVQGQVQNNERAKKFLEAIQDGFKQALEAVQPPA